MEGKQNRKRGGEKRGVAGVGVMIQGRKRKNEKYSQ